MHLDGAKWRLGPGSEVRWFKGQSLSEKAKKKAGEGCAELKIAQSER